MINKPYSRTKKSKNSLKTFIKKAFGIVHPGTPYLANWHIDLISEYLEAVTMGEIKRLIINIPPRSLKSTCVSVAWPAWLLGQDPRRRIICASYSQNLSTKLSLDCRHLMQSQQYQDMFPLTQLNKKQNQKRKFLTAELGCRIATSVGGTITGEGGNFLILDDPHNAMDVHSKVKRENVINWFQQSFASRIDDKKKGAIVIVMQRLHVEDLTGFLLKNQSQNWELLNIPAISPSDTVYKIKNKEYTYLKNTFLHENRDGKKELENVKTELGSYAFAAQYLQSPYLAENAMIKKSWIKYFDTIMPLKEYDSIIQSWDTAIKSGDEHSYSVGTTWGKYENNYYLLDVFREKLEYPELKAQVLRLALKWDVDLLLIEDKASGQSLLQDIKRQHHNLKCYPIKTRSDKLTRFARTTQLFEAGRVWIYQKAHWLTDYENELFGFPHCKNNDQVDSTSQFLCYSLVEKVMPQIRGMNG